MVASEFFDSERVTTIDGSLYCPLRLFCVLLKL